MIRPRNQSQINGGGADERISSSMSSLRSSACLLNGRSFARGVAVSAQHFEARSTTHTRLLEMLRTALKMTEKAVNEFAYYIQRGTPLIVCQSADAKYSQDCFLFSSRSSALLFDRKSVTGKSRPTGATRNKVQLIGLIVGRVHILPSLRLSVEQCEVFLLQHFSSVRVSRTADTQQMA
jgi:hypothetical protein